MKYKSATDNNYNCITFFYSFICKALFKTELSASQFK